MSPPGLVQGRLRRFLGRRVNDTLSRSYGVSGCIEALNMTRPKLVMAVHRRFLDAGVDALVTNTADAAPALLNRYRMFDEAFAMTYMGAELARRTAVAFAADRRSRRRPGVIGDVRLIGRRPFGGAAGLADLRDVSRNLVSAQVGGGVDAVHLEVPHRAYLLEAAVDGARRGMAEAGRPSVPILLTIRYEIVAEEWDRYAVDDAIACAAATAAGLNVASLSVDPAGLLQHWPTQVSLLAQQWHGALHAPLSTPIARSLDPSMLGPGARRLTMAGVAHPAATKAVRRTLQRLAGAMPSMPAVTVPPATNDDRTLSSAG